MTQARLGRLIHLSQSQISAIERGVATNVPLATWISLGLALSQPFAAAFSRPTSQQPADAGHLDLQETALRAARRTGRTGRFELPTRPSDPARSVDVLVRDDRRRELLILECWNTFGDLGAAARTTARKISQAQQLAVAIAGDGERYEVRACWLVRPTAANRGLIRRYPHIFRAQCPGSSLGWVEALANGAEPPVAVGLVWADAAADRFVPVRLREGA